MSARPQGADLVIGITPLGEPSARLCAAVDGAGGIGVLDLGAGDRRAREELALALRWSAGPIAVRVARGCALRHADLRELLGADADRIDTVVLGWHAPWQVRELPGRVLVEVTSRAEAVRAVRAGAHGLIARGSEAGGRVGELSSFVLAQHLLTDPELRETPVWLAGGIGPHTAAAAVIGGAAGVVLDTQLALLAESDLRPEVAAALAASDGSDTAIVHGHRVLATQGGPRGNAAADLASVPMTDVEMADLIGGRDLATRLLPVGQDAFLATRFAEEFGTAARAVRSLRRSITDALAADEHPVLAPGSALARALGTDLPVAQGPMTRVSDLAGFAAAVAEQGALPFVALALATGEQTRKLLAETRATLGARPWGVGVLGFASEDIRKAQLEVIRELRPSVALIAGGNPAQAAALESVGISTFIHVASPNLLRQFLDAGARKFVFEGAECGGHVGPRSSFALWECQLGVLAEHLDDGRPADGLQVLFAGGIHDERSAAMVAAAAEPLSRRGASIGVLMGTGYLFTEEAVAHGAVQPLFQRQVLAADGTALLETAPGHATRCLPSPFVDTFQSISAELAEQGVPKRDAWEKLEQLNVGRLRIASKGIRREGAELIEVGEDDQLAEGMFMAGQVVALRSQVTTVAKLHEDVTSGAERFRAERITALRAELGLTRPQDEDRAEQPAPVDVAIIGMACVYPGAPDLASFWANIIGKVDSITEVPADRWDTDIYYSAEGAKGGNKAAGERSRSKWGGFLDQIPFDALRYGVPPSTLTAIEPVQLLALEIAHRALVDSGYADRDDFDRERVGVVFGAEAGSDLLNTGTMRMMLPSYLGSLPKELDEQLPKVTEDTFAGQLSNVISGRIANRLDFGGASYSVDAACGSSLAALDSACKDLVSGHADMVMCGGADLHNAANDFLLFSSVGALSPTGKCRTFDSAADGIALGEGVACVVLKRLADAERDGDRIYGVIEGVGSGSDGRSLGLTAPRPEGQRRALERAYQRAGISPAEVGLIEAHGTGTVVGDRTELSTLEAVFGEADVPAGSCVVGSVKSQIGHTKCAAGMAGLIKAAMAVHTGVKPPTLHVDRPNPAWQADTSPFAFHSDPAPWLVPPAQRIAGVSAFGFGGTNFHAVLRGHRSAELTRHGLAQWPVELFTFRGVDQASAVREVEWLRDLTAVNDAHGRPWTLRDLARSTALRADRGRAAVRIALVATDLDNLAELLSAAPTSTGDPARGLFVAGESAEPGKLAVLFPGQGSQKPGMLAELFVAFPEIRRHARSTADRAEITAAMFPPAVFDADARRAAEDRLRDTAIAQPALGIAGLAVHHLLGRLGVTPDLVAGHSYGELVALAAAGAIDPDTLLDLSAARAKSILDSVDSAGGDPGAMAAVAAGPAEVARILAEAGLADEVVPANQNSPRQTVIAGPTDRLDIALDALRAAGLAGKKLPVACAFHSPVVGGAGERFAAVLAEQEIAAPEIPVWANRTAAVYRAEPAAVRAELAAQIGAPVRFVDQIEAMHADGARIFLEAGPGRVLGGLVDAILGDRPHTTVSCDGGLRGFLTAVARLAVAGVDLRTGWLTTGRDATDVSRATPSRRPGWTVDGQTVRTADGNYLPGGLAPARRVEVTMPGSSVPAGQSSGQSGPAPSEREALIAEYLRASREMVAAQRDVMLSFLGAAPNPAAPAPLPAARPEPLPTQVAPSTPDTQATRPTPPTPAPTAPEPARTPTPDPEPVDAMSMVVGLIAERTGYPAEMIEPDLDLEADLSVDSIKRTEIAGELASRLGLDGADERFDDLVRMRTTQAMADWIDTLAGGAPAESAAPAEPPGESTVVVEPVPAPAGVAGGPDLTGEPPQRFVWRLAEADGTPGDPAVFTGSRIVLAGGEPTVVEALSSLLRAHGARVTAISAASGRAEIAGPVDGLVFLDALCAADEPVLPAAFGLFRAALRHQPRWLLAVAPSTDGRPESSSAGLRGLFRSMALEYPDSMVRLLEIEAATQANAVAIAVIGELLTEGRQPVIVLDRDIRREFTLQRAGLGALAMTGAGPAGDGAAEAAAVGLGRDSVVLLIGGARGITARFARTLAIASGCRLELVGRTAPGVEPEAPVTVAARDLPALRAALAGSGHQGGPAAIDRAAKEILARREVAETLAELRRHGSEANYRAVDVRDTQAIGQLVKQVHTEHGRIDGVVYAAGVIEDKLLAEKDDESFGRVFGTKVDGASAVLAELAGLPGRPAFVVLFGSVAAALGNRGQTDYAAANDALETLGARWADHTGGRALTVHWGPWAPADHHGGMVSTELARAYHGRGIELIDPAEGVASLLRELAWGNDELRAVVLNAALAWTEATAVAPETGGR
ncbi:MAG TPA: SDR family NAD(P)-dependent oxidoreductase [Pseudonocardiaceae bacterium]|nr:SDR family NAD(P)-dependent oxidoreductase [Pseudonocardiaceae bacterium]